MRKNWLKITKKNYYELRKKMIKNCEKKQTRNISEDNHWNKTTTRFASSDEFKSNGDFICKLWKDKLRILKNMRLMKR